MGNGSLGLFTAILIKEQFPNAAVFLFGEQQRVHAASTAAGAMANVYAEMEKATGYISEVNERYLEMGRFGSQEWRKFLKKTGGENCVTSEDTYVFLQKSASSFENANFEAVRESAVQGQVLEELTIEQMRSTLPASSLKAIERVLKIKGEFSVSVKNLFLHMDSIAQSMGIQVENKRVDKIDSFEMNLLVDGRKIRFEKIVVMSGIHTHKLIHDKSLIPIYQGVGVAMLLNPIKDLEFNKLRRGVFRSVNRGGAQCGIHLVPREDGRLYLGAGNYVSKLENPVVRMDTVRYLLTTLEKDLIGRETAYELSGEFILGLRPRSLDGFPAIGSLKSNQNIFIATGTNRAGLTWAPFVASQALLWLKEENLSDLIRGWSPDRTPIMYGTKDQGVEYFVSSRMSNAREHGLIPKETTSEFIYSKSQEFRIAASVMADAVAKKLNLPLGQTVNPDNWGAILSD